MNLRLSKQNYIAGFLLVYSLGLMLKDALKLDIGTGTALTIVFIIWSCIHYLFGKRKIALGGVALSASVLFLAIIQPISLRWIDYIKYKNPLQLGLSNYAADLLKLDEWPSFMFYTVDAVIQGAHVSDQVYSFNLLIIGLLTLFIGQITYRSILNKKHYGYFLIPLLLFVQQWFQYAENIQVQFSLYFIGFVMVAGSYTHEKSLSTSKGSAYGTKHFAAKRYGAYLFILGAVVIMISNVVLFFTPVSGINLAIGEMVPNILDMRTGYKRQSMTMFTFKQTMYQPYEERLGGPVVRGENPVLLRVWSDKAGVYLRGRVKTKYTGTSWVSEHGLYTNNNDYSAHTGLPITKQKSYEITVVPEGITTRTLFAPLGTKNIKLDKSKVFLNPDGAMYYKRESFEEAMSIYTIRGVDYSMRIEDKDLYLNLPDPYSEKVQSKALELTEGLESDYDKMEALKSWLRENYPYSLEPGLPPGDVDFVSYFLFEEKSGYCTYFASALAVMGRSIDIPTRYVEGFILPGMREPDGSYAVRADRAHAWTEAYIEGEGWRIFEATPAYSGTTARLREDQLLDTSEVLVTAVDDEAQFALDAKEGLLDVAIGEGSDYVRVETPDYSKEILYGLMSLVFLAFVVIIIVLQKVKSHFEKGTRNSLSIRLIYYLEDLIDIDSDTMTPAEKLEKYMSSRDDFDLTMYPHAYDIIDKVNVVLYSGMDVSEETLDVIRNAVYQIERETKGRFNRIRYLFNR